MNKLTHPEKLRRWLLANKGLAARVAEELGYSRAFVHDVLYGRRQSRTGDLESRLAELGAPGFTRQEPQEV